jgi:hypothetical protein
MVGYELTGCLPWVFHGRIPSIVDGRERLTDQFTDYTFFPRQRRAKKLMRKAPRVPKINVWNL